MIVRQLFDQATWTYADMIAESVSKQAVFIDPANTY